jgi:dTDP-glucose 4,6-dehydratase
MKILVTGAAGFIGHYLIQEFCEDHDVIAMVRPGTKNLDRLHSVVGNFTVLQHDINDPITDVHDVDIILHAGANPSATDSIQNPQSVVQDNVLSTLNLLQLARKSQVKKFVYYSSGEVFGPVPVGHDSQADDAYRSASPYAASKAAGEELCMSYASSFGIPMSIIHINNTFGPRCQANRLPVIIINKVLRGQELTIHAGADGVISGRRWFYAGDVASHTRFILERQTEHCEKWNSAGHKFIDNLSFARDIADIMGETLNYNLETIKNVHHNLCFSVDPVKLYDRGWQASINYQQRLRETVYWYMANPEWLTRK